MKMTGLGRRKFIGSAAALAACLGVSPMAFADEMGRKIFKDDWDYLKRKWREPCANPATGLEREEFAKAIEKLIAEREPVEDWSFVKARVFACGCDRAAIGISHHDWYPAFAFWHYHRQHPFGPLMGRRETKVDNKFTPGLRMQLNEAWKTGQCSIWKDYCHCSPDWDRILALGFRGMKDELLAHWKDGVYCQSKLMAIDAVFRFLDRLIAETEAEIVRAPGPRLPKELAALKRLRAGRPETAYDALLFIYLFWVMCENFDKYQARTLGNIDRLLTPYYRADLAAGRTTEAEFRDQLAHFWWQWGSINNYWGQPVYVGGTRADGTTEYNEVSKIVLDIHDELALPTPKMHVKIAANTPDWVWTRTLDMARRMRPLTFVGEESQARVIRSMGYSAEQARTFMLWGCYEWAIRDSANDTFGAAVNLPKQLELLLAEAATNEAFAAADFAAFKRIYFGRVTDVVRKAMAAAAVNERHLAEINPSLLFSLATPYSMETGRDAYCGGMRYGNNTGIWLTGFATTVDALMAVKELVYGEGEKVEKVGGGGEGKRMSLKELGEMMARNWEGHEDLRLKMARSRHKWGNNDQEANALGAEFVKAVTPVINGVPNARGGVYKAVGHAARFFYDFGRWTGATPDGRKAGEELSKNFSPVMGADTEGPTALVNTHAVLDARDLPGDFPLDVALLPATVAGEKGLVVMRSLVEQNFANGGMVIQFNVHDADTLRDAQRHPEKYENLQVRVAGWNVRWNDIPKAEQDKFILRAERISK